MFRIYKRKGSPFYWADISIPDPSGGSIPLRIRQTTKKQVKRDALAAAAAMEQAAMKRAGADGDTADAVLAVLQEATRLHSQGKLTLEAGRALVARMVASSTGEKLEFTSIRQWFTDWLKGRRNELKESTFAQYSCHVGFLLDWLGQDADKRLESLTRAKLTQFRDALRAGFRAPDKDGKPRTPTPRRRRTTDFILTTIGACLRVAVKDKLLLGNPADGVEPLGTEDSETREPFSAAEVEALFAAAPSHEWRALMHVAFYGGLRLMDGARLRWDNVDLVEKVMKFTPRKTSRKGRVLTVPLHPKLQGELESLPSADDPDAFVLPELGRTPRRDLCEGFATIMDSAKVPRHATAEAADGRRRFFRRGFHSFRHSLVSALHNSDVPPELRMKLLGHSSAAVHQTYTHTELESLRAALEKLS